MTTSYANDPFDAADNPSIRPAEFFGKLEVDAWFCALIKGQGKVRFDNERHPIDQRRTGVAARHSPGRAQAELSADARRHRRIQGVDGHYVAIVAQSGFAVLA